MSVAGTYEVAADQWDEIHSKVGQPLDYTRHVRGATVDLNAADARRLLAVGAVVEPGSLERATAELAVAQAQAALAALPEDVRAQLVATLTGDGEPATAPSSARKAARRKPAAKADQEGEGESGAGGGVERPLNAAVKPTWVAAVVAKTGMSEDAANAMTTDELHAAFDSHQG